jgi:hypothetical protein
MSADGYNKLSNEVIDAKTMSFVTLFPVEHLVWLCRYYLPAQLNLEHRVSLVFQFSISHVLLPGD